MSKNEKKRTKAPATWKTKEGQIIRIADMTDDHLRNTLRLFYRHAIKTKDAAIAQGIKVLGTLRGEAAMNACNADIDRLEAQGIDEMLAGDKKWKTLLAEAKKRDLDWEYTPTEIKGFSSQSFMRIFPKLTETLRTGVVDEVDDGPGWPGHDQDEGWGHPRDRMSPGSF